SQIHISPSLALQADIEPGILPIPPLSRQDPGTDYFSVFSCFSFDSALAFVMLHRKFDVIVVIIAIDPCSQTRDALVCDPLPRRAGDAFGSVCF
ncbi:MAG: hypothetical protein ACREJB_02840, partial [Planctomycetaceae bacterium]